MRLLVVVLTHSFFLASVYFIMRTRQSCRRRWDVDPFGYGSPIVRLVDSTEDLIPALAYLDGVHQYSDRSERSWGSVMRRGLAEENCICSELRNTHRWLGRRDGY